MSGCLASAEPAFVRSTDVLRTIQNCEESAVRLGNFCIFVIRYTRSEMKVRCGADDRALGNTVLLVTGMPIQARSLNISFKFITKKLILQTVLILSRFSIHFLLSILVLTLLPLSIDTSNQEAHSIRNSAEVVQVRSSDDQSSSADGIASIADDLGLGSGEGRDTVVVLGLASIAIGDETDDAVLHGRGKSLRSPVDDGCTLRVAASHDLGLRALGSC